MKVKTLWYGLGLSVWIMIQVGAVCGAETVDVVVIDLAMTGPFTTREGNARGMERLNSSIPQDGGSRRAI